MADDSDLAVIVAMVMGVVVCVICAGMALGFVARFGYATLQLGWWFAEKILTL